MVTWMFIVLSLCNNFAIRLYCYHMISRLASNTSFIISGLTRPCINFIVSSTQLHYRCNTIYSLEDTSITLAWTKYKTRFPLKDDCPTRVFGFTPGFMFYVLFVYPLLPGFFSEKKKSVTRWTRKEVNIMYLIVLTPIC